MHKDPYYSEKDTLRWHEANFQIIQVFMRNPANRLRLHSSISDSFLSMVDRAWTTVGPIKNIRLFSVFYLDRLEFCWRVYAA
jgi:hypothetical protein